MQRYTIGTCGFCSTGSSVVTDILKEYEDNVVIDDFEFTLTWMPDGIEDLYYHMFDGCKRDISSKIAISRFKKRCCGPNAKHYLKYSKGYFKYAVQNYIDSITQVKWVGTIPRFSANSMTIFVKKIFRKLHIYKYLALYEEKTGHHIIIYPLKELSMSIKPENFKDESKKLVMSILDLMGRDLCKNVVLDQPFCGNNPQSSFPYYENPLAIVVDRDPRDHYLFSKLFLYKKGVRLIPTQKVEDYVIFYKNMRHNMPYLNPNKRILNLHFEDFIYRPEETRTLLLDFTGTNPETWKRKIFEPEQSIHNTQLFKRFPEYSKDIKYIEKELKDYLYPFEEFGEIDTSGHMFYGRSRLNKRN